MLFEMGVADAYGACFECASKRFVEENNHLKYVPHPRNRKRRTEDMPSVVGRYTDDTQMSLAIAEAMLDENEPWTKESIADRFVSVFRRDKRRGYTTFFLNVLLNSENGTEMMSKIGGTSTKSGAAMRAAPLGLYENFSDGVSKAKLQATVTHDSWLGRNSAVGVALMTYYFYHEHGPRTDLHEWLRDMYFSDTIFSPHPFEVDNKVVECWSPGRKVEVDAWDVLHAAIYAIEAHDSMSEILKQCVEYTGDVDTVAAIALGVASCAKDIEQDLPDVLVNDLENKTYGRDYLKSIDEKLLEKFPRSTVDLFGN